MPSLERTISIAKVAIVLSAISVIGVFMVSMANVAGPVVEVERTVDVVLEHKEVLEKGMLKNIPSYSMP